MNNTTTTATTPPQATTLTHQTSLSLSHSSHANQQLPPRPKSPRPVNSPKVSRGMSFRVQESDGNFFESFTALAWKQENRKRRAASEVSTQFILF